MIARLLGIATLGLIGAAVLWGLLWLQRDRPVVAMAGAAAIAGIHAIVLAIEFVLVLIVNRGDPAPRASAKQLLRAWWGETCVATRVFGWVQPFRSRRFADRALPTGLRGVVLVHGFLCNRGAWNHWLPRLQVARVPYVAVDLHTVFASIDDCVPILEEAVRRLETATGRAPVIVAHSMGGLVVRAWLHHCASDARVHRVITIGTPHLGTWLARFAIGTNTRQMRRAGAWLGALADREQPTRAANFTCFYGHCDNVVIPASAATLPGADNRHLAGVAHVEMAYQAEVLAELMRWLDDAAEASAASSPPTPGSAAAATR
jgi:pimeloyl-ACP methyl ester carboxylesterase